MWLVMSLAGIFNIFSMSFAIDAGCDYSQNMVLGQPYYVYNSEYPNYYKQGISCRWIGQSPPGTQIILSCEDINLPPTAMCQGDRLAVSLTGNPNFQDAHNYCGTGTLSMVSSANRISIGLFSAWNSRGGRFLCTITPVQSTTTTTPPPTPSPSNCDCGWKQQRRIVGGEESGVNEYPSMAALIDIPSRNLYCGASIISPRYALTAAHCTTNRNPFDIGLLVGDHDITTGNDTNSAALYVLDKMERHPDYVANTEENDIAVVRTQSRIVFSLNVGPVCLPFRYSNASFTGVTVTVLGWGTLDFSGPKSDTLQKVNLAVLSNMDCAQRTVTPPLAKQMCTYTSGKDACQSDSGGPLLWMDNNTRRLQLIGLVSFGLGCATTRPGINTRVTSYLTWIVSVTSDYSYCIK